MPDSHQRLSHKPYGPSTSVTRLQLLRQQTITGTSNAPITEHTDLRAHDFAHSPGLCDMNLGSMTFLAPKDGYLMEILPLYTRHYISDMGHSLITLYLLMNFVYFLIHNYPFSWLYLLSYPLLVTQTVQKTNLWRRWSIGRTSFVRCNAGAIGSNLPVGVNIDLNVLNRVFLEKLLVAQLMKMSLLFSPPFWYSTNKSPLTVSVSSHINPDKNVPPDL